MDPTSSILCDSFLLLHILLLFIHYHCYTVCYLNIPLYLLLMEICVVNTVMNNAAVHFLVLVSYCTVIFSKYILIWLEWIYDRFQDILRFSSQSVCDSLQSHQQNSFCTSSLPTLCTVNSTFSRSRKCVMLPQFFFSFSYFKMWFYFFCFCYPGFVNILCVFEKNVYSAVFWVQ